MVKSSRNGDASDGTDSFVVQRSPVQGAMKSSALEMYAELSQHFQP